MPCLMPCCSAACRAPIAMRSFCPNTQLMSRLSLSTPPINFCPLALVQSPCTLLMRCMPGKRFSASQNPRWRSMAGDDVCKPVISTTLPRPWSAVPTHSPITRPISWLSAPMKAVYLCESVLRSKSITGMPLSKARLMAGEMVCI